MAALAHAAGSCSHAHPTRSRLMHPSRGGVPTTHTPGPSSLHTPWEPCLWHILTVRQTQLTPPLIHTRGLLASPGLRVHLERALRMCWRQVEQVHVSTAQPCLRRFAHVDHAVVPCGEGALAMPSRPTSSPRPKSHQPSSQRPSNPASCTPTLSPAPAPPPLPTDTTLPCSSPGPSPLALLPMPVLSQFSGHPTPSHRKVPPASISVQAPSAWPSFLQLSPRPQLLTQDPGG